MSETEATEAWTIQRVLRWASDDFAKRGLESARLDAELLLGRVLSFDRLKLILEAHRELTAHELSSFRELIRRRRQHEPIAYILGEREFYGHMFRVDRRVLIPRPDTETLVEVALARTREAYMYGRALDLCTGSGCVAISLAKARPTWRVLGTDVSGDALAVARKNAERLGVSFNVGWLLGDLFQALDNNAKFDLIVSNPPYIPVEEVKELAPDIVNYEPHLALKGGGNGTEILERLIHEAPAHLNAGGTLAVEIAWNQAPQVSDLFEAAKFTNVRVNKDYGGRDRVVSGVLR
ncbi:MAG: peptide chain release factor N(5)-glutamine methyltransferase [Polyangiaceae bacterium]|nr:peptide chain release factor N(5)-glutamine methyltransferase [Polyangiaceae bacterium]